MKTKGRVYVTISYNLIRYSKIRKEKDIMSNTRQKYDEEFKKNAVRLSYASNRTIKEVAEDLGVIESMLYRWRKRYTPKGDKTQYATMEEENRSLRLEVAELSMERDMLKKAAAYFAKNQK